MKVNSNSFPSIFQSRPKTNQCYICICIIYCVLVPEQMRKELFVLMLVIDIENIAKTVLHSIITNWIEKILYLNLNLPQFVRNLAHSSWWLFAIMGALLAERT